MAAAEPGGRALAAARLLLGIDAVNFRADPPYTLTSGWVSPVYVDCRRPIGFPVARARLVAMLTDLVEADCGRGAFDAVAGGETAGIPWAAWLADRLQLPMQYVRKQPKGFGRNARIEGPELPGARTLLVEDLATDGRSKAGFADALRGAGQEVGHALVVFSYSVFAHAPALMAGAGLELHALTTWRDVLAVARADARFGPGVLDEVQAFLDDPAGWSAARGGRSAP